MQTQWLLREYFSVILEGALHLKQLSQLVSTIPVSVDTKSVFAFTLAPKSARLNVSLLYTELHVNLL